MYCAKRQVDPLTGCPQYLSILNVSVIILKLYICNYLQYDNYWLLILARVKYPENILSETLYGQNRILNPTNTLSKPYNVYSENH